MINVSSCSLLIIQIFFKELNGLGQSGAYVATETFEDVSFFITVL